MRGHFCATCEAWHEVADHLPEWFVTPEGPEGHDFEAGSVRAATASQAVERWARDADRADECYAIARRGGDAIRVVVRKAGGTAERYTVQGGWVPSYVALEARPAPEVPA